MRFGKMIPPVAAAIAAAAVMIPEAQAYVRSTTNNSQTPLRWHCTNCLYLRPNSAGSADITDGSDLKAIERAAQNWVNAVKHCSYITFRLLDPKPDVKVEYLEQNSSSSEQPLNENAVVWVESDWPHDHNAAALTTVSFVDQKGHSQDGLIVDADLEINGTGNLKWSTVKKAGYSDAENTLTHELGHFLGLDHPCDDGTRSPTPKDHTGQTIPKCSSSAVTKEMRDVTMYNFASPLETKKRTPEADDIAGICAIYPLADDPGDCRPPDVPMSTGCSVSSSGCTLASRPPLSFVLLTVCLCWGLLMASRRRR